MRRSSTHVTYLQVLRLLFKLGGALAGPTSKFKMFEIADNGPDEEPGSTTFWLKVLLSLGLVVAGGVFAG